jgi:hypothetical protein
VTHKSRPARAGGTAGRWAIPAPGSTSNRSPPTRPKRDHHHRSSGQARAVSLGRSLRASCPPLARCWLALGIPASTRQQRQLHDTGSPLTHPYSPPVDAIEAPTGRSRLLTTKPIFDSYRILIRTGRSSWGRPESRFTRVSTSAASGSSPGTPAARAISTARVARSPRGSPAARRATGPA